MAQPARHLLEVEIALDDIAPRIWRRVLVRSDTFLPKMHLIFQIAIGWENYHIHEFLSGTDRYGVPDDDFPDPNLKNEKKVRISQLLTHAGDAATYLYDFGDGWTHSIKLIDIADWSPSVISPVCIAGERSCPPEDVGGPPGYETYLAALSDPNHEMHNQYVEWRGPVFNVDAFDINTVNVQIGRQFRRDA